MSSPPFVLWKAKKHEPLVQSASRFMLFKGQQLDSAHSHRHGEHKGTTATKQTQGYKDVTTCLQWVEEQMVRVQLVT